jgi:hypothetical protein
MAFHYADCVINWETHTLPISVVAAIFFDQRPYWIRYQEKLGHLDGIGSRASSGDRAYTLDDVRQMASALLKYGTIDYFGYTNCLDRINSMHEPVFKRRRERGRKDRFLWAEPGPQ